MSMKNHGRSLDLPTQSFIPGMTFGCSTSPSVLDHDLRLHLSDTMRIAPWDSSSFFYNTLLLGILNLPDLFLTLIWSNSSVNDPITFASTFGKATATSICTQYGPHQVYRYAESFIRSIVLGRYLQLDVTVFRPPTHAPHPRLLIKVAQLLVDHPYLFDIGHFNKYYHQQVDSVRANVMVALQYAVHQHNQRMVQFHSTLADIQQSPHAAAILGVPMTVTPPVRLAPCCVPTTHRKGRIQSVTELNLSPRYQSSDKGFSVPGVGDLGDPDASGCGVGGLGDVGFGHDGGDGFGGSHGDGLEGDGLGRSHGDSDSVVDSYRGFGDEGVGDDGDSGSFGNLLSEGDDGDGGSFGNLLSEGDDLDGIQNADSGRFGGTSGGDIGSPSEADLQQLDIEAVLASIQLILGLIVVEKDHVDKFSAAPWKDDHGLPRSRNVLFADAIGSSSGDVPSFLLILIGEDKFCTCSRKMPRINLIWDPGGHGNNESVADYYSPLFIDEVDQTGETKWSYGHKRCERWYNMTLHYTKLHFIYDNT